MELIQTSISQLQEYAKGQLVELPPFAEGQAFVARLKRPSLLALAKAGKIPNELLTSAGEMFSGARNSSQKDKKDSVLNEMYDLYEVICESSFVSPTYTEIKEAGIELTDDQKSFVFQYSQQGVKALSDFRKE